MEGEESRADMEVIMVQHVDADDSRDRIISLKVRRDMLKCWDTAAKILGFNSRSELIRVAVQEYLSRRQIRCTASVSTVS